VPIFLTCPGCARGLRIADGLAGKKGKCPACGHLFRIPHASRPGLPEAPGSHPPAAMTPAAARARPSVAAWISFIMGFQALPWLLIGGRFLVLLWGFLALVAVVTGVIALVSILASGGILKGKPIAIAGLSLGGVTFLLGAFVFLPAETRLRRVGQPRAGIPFSPLEGARRRAARVHCAHNLHDIGKAILSFADDHDRRFPESFDVLLQEGYLKDAASLRCPAQAEGSEWGYLLVPYKTLDEAGPWAIAFDRKENHDGSGRNVLFADGHVKWVPEEDLYRTLVWGNNPVLKEFVLKEFLEEHGSD